MGAAGASAEHSLASVSGAISEIAPTHFRVSGLSRFVRLGELIGVNTGGKPQIGEVVRIDSEGIIAKPFDRQFAGGLGSVAYRMPPLSFAPDPSWKGRVINALGAPLDGQGPSPLDRAPYRRKPRRLRP